MGNFYVNYTVRSSDAQAVAKAFSGRRAFVTSVPGQPVVTFDEAADSQEEAVVKGLGCHLSEAAGVPVLGVLNHDDDILWCGLFESGQCVDEYDSSPDYFKDEGSHGVQRVVMHPSSARPLVPTIVKPLRAFCVTTITSLRARGTRHW